MERVPIQKDLNQVQYSTGAICGGTSPRVRELPFLLRIASKIFDAHCPALSLNSQTASTAPAMVPSAPAEATERSPRLQGRDVGLEDLPSDVLFSVAE